MGFLSRLKGKKEEGATLKEEIAAVECPHVALLPRWDVLEDMGKHDAVSRYDCEACGASFSREESQRMMEREAERLKLGTEG